MGKVVCVGCAIRYNAHGSWRVDNIWFRTRKDFILPRPTSPVSPLIPFLAALPAWEREDWTRSLPAILADTLLYLFWLFIACYWRS
jgi:hypothetical protein